MKPITIIRFSNRLANFIFTHQQAGLLPSLPFLVGCLLLPGCTGSTYSSHFDCPMGEGAGCASISRVNKLIDRREIDLGNDDAPLGKNTAGDPSDGRLPAEGQPPAPGNQVYVYYGPDQLSRLIPTEEPTSPPAQEGS